MTSTPPTPTEPSGSVTAQLPSSNETREQTCLPVAKSQTLVIPAQPAMKTNPPSELNFTSLGRSITGNSHFSWPVDVSQMLALKLDHDASPSQRPSGEKDIEDVARPVPVYNSRSSSPVLQ